MDAIIGAYERYPFPYSDATKSHRIYQILPSDKVRTKPIAPLNHIMCELIKTKSSVKAKWAVGCTLSIEMGYHLKATKRVSSSKLGSFGKEMKDGFSEVAQAIVRFLSNTVTRQSWKPYSRMMRFEPTRPVDSPQ